MKNKGIFYALGAGVAWGGSLGVFVRAMESLGFSPIQIVSVRATISAAAFLIFALIKERRAFKVCLKDIWIFLCAGCISITLSNWCYCTAAAKCSLAVTSILEYTSPVWVTMLSALIFKEKITALKAAALSFAAAGCVLVSGITGGVGKVSASGAAAGIAAGLTYGLYTIFTRFAVPKYSVMTINLYSFWAASVSSLAIAGPVDTVSAVCAPGAFPTAAIGGIICTVVPYYLYTKALETLDNGRASILATVEPVVTALVSVLYFKEPLSIAAAIGTALILSAVIMLALRKESGKKAPVLTETTDIR